MYGRTISSEQKRLPVPAPGVLPELSAGFSGSKGKVLRCGVMLWLRVSGQRLRCPPGHGIQTSIGGQGVTILSGAMGRFLANGQSWHGVN